MLGRVLDQNMDAGGGEELMPTTPGCSVNRLIQNLAQKYCIDCKGSFDELSKIIQKVVATRRELAAYDREQAGITSSPRTSLEENKQQFCFGCASAATEHCIMLLRARASDDKQNGFRVMLSEYELLQELVERNLRQGGPQVCDQFFVGDVVSFPASDSTRGSSSSVSPDSAQRDSDRHPERADTRPHFAGVEESNFVRFSGLRLRGGTRDDPAGHACPDEE